MQGVIHRARSKAAFARAINSRLVTHYNSNSTACMSKQHVSALIQAQDS